MTKQPGIGKGVIQATSVYKEGLECEIECGRWKMTADMSPRGGGSGAGPSPGEYMSMALGSCQVITAVLWAARYEVPIEKLEVTFVVEKDARGLYGVDDQPSRWSGVSCRVDIQSPASEKQIQKVLEAAWDHSPMRDNLEHPFSIKYESNITTPAL